MLLATPERHAWEVIAEIFTPPPPIDYTAWAEKNVILPSVSSEPGPYNPARSPWMTTILTALTPDDPCEIIAWMKAVQIGGTLISQIFIGGSLVLDPGPCMFVQPVDANSKAFNLQKWRPFIRSCPPLAKLLPERSRSAAVSLSYQETVDGRAFVVHGAAGSPSDLSQKSVARIVEDDLDKWPEPGETGDPEAAADGRTEAFRRVGRAKILKIGNPTITESSRIYRAYRNGSQEQWGIPCPSCGALTPLVWDDLRNTIEAAANAARERGEDEAAAVEAGAAAAVFHCRHCESPIREADYHRAKSKGAMLVGRPERLKRQRSFYIWSAYVKNWGDIARGWFDAKKHVGTEQTFLNETVGLPYDGAGEAPDWEALLRRSEAGHPLGTIPAGMDIFVAAADCQGDRVEVHVMAFGPDLRRATVDYLVIPYHIGAAECREALDGLLQRKWRNAAGHARTLEMFGIDGGHWKADVETWVRRHDHRRVWMVRGAKDQYAGDLVTVSNRSERKAAKASLGNSQVYTHWVGSAGIKAQMYACLMRGTDPDGPDWWGFPTGLGEVFFRQLTAEKRIKNEKTGRFFWKKYGDNEVLDTAVYAQALAVQVGWKRFQPSHWEERRRIWGVPPTNQGDLFDGPPPAPAPPPAANAGQADAAPADAAAKAPAAPPPKLPPKPPVQPLSAAALMASLNKRR